MNDSSSAPSIFIVHLHFFLIFFFEGFDIQYAQKVSQDISPVSLFQMIIHFQVEYFTGGCLFVLVLFLVYHNKRIS